MILTRSYINFSPKTLILNKMHGVESVQIRSSFWSEFSCILYSVRIKENTDRKELRIGRFSHIDGVDCIIYSEIYIAGGKWASEDSLQKYLTIMFFCIRFIETERLPQLQNYFFAFLWLMNIFIWNKIMFYSRDI